MLQIPFNGAAIVTNSFRVDKYNPHHGIDYAINFRTAIIAPTDGLVTAAVYKFPKDMPQDKRQWVANTQSDPFKKVVLGKMLVRALNAADYGNYVKLDHGKGVSTLCAHLDELCVSEGQVVKEGELIGYSDTTGNSTGNHLHYEIRVDGIVIDPATFDYSFKGSVGAQVEVNVMSESVKILTDLYVRAGPARSYRLAGSKELHAGDVVPIVGWCEGEEISGNKVWYKSSKGNYFWSGGTDMKGLADAKKGIQMTQEEYEAKKADLEAKKAEVEALLAALDKEYADAQAAKAAAPEPEVKVEEVAPVVEPAPVVEEVAPVAETTAEPKADADIVASLETLLAELKAKLGK